MQTLPDKFHDIVDEIFVFRVLRELVGYYRVFSSVSTIRFILSNYSTKCHHQLSKLMISWKRSDNICPLGWIFVE